MSKNKNKNLSALHKRMAPRLNLQKGIALQNPKERLKSPLQ